MKRIIDNLTRQHRELVRTATRMLQRFLDERARLRQQFDDYHARWLSAAAIEGGAERFIEETRGILGLLWNRMKMEDDVLHPEIVRVFAAA